jgi:hypothetical protein
MFSGSEELPPARSLLTRPQTEGILSTRHQSWSVIRSGAKSREAVPGQPEDVTMSQIQEHRVIEGIALPGPGEWWLDPVHTSVESWRAI